MNKTKETVYQELLVTQCMRGRQEAYEELIGLWEKRLFYYVRRIVDSEQDAWDVLQETWLKVIKQIKKLRDPKKFPAWVYRIARNTSLNHIRSRKELYSYDENIETQNNFDEKSDLYRFENAEQVHFGLGRLSLPHREILTLFFLQDLTMAEISSVLEIPVGTVKSRLYYARQALWEVLKKEAGYE